jgi:hypothetical protein
MTDFILFNKMIAEDLISSVFRTAYFDDLRKFPYILAEKDVGDPERFLDYIDQRLDWLCFDIRADEFITVEEEYIPVFDNNDESDDESDDDEIAPLVIPPTKFKDIQELTSSPTVFKVKPIKLNVIKREKVEEEEKNKEPEKAVQLDYDTWTKKSDVCKIDFDIEKEEKKIVKFEKSKPLKTRMCPFGDKCKKFKKGCCNFAHNRNELVRRKRYTNSSDVLGNHLNLLFKDLPKPKPKPRPTPVKTRMCTYKGKCKKNNCTFAHTLDEWNPIVCSFDGRCKNDECKFWHKKTETKKELNKRLN